MKSRLNFKTEEDRDTQFVYVCFEFVYFFMHMTLRSAHSHDLGPERTKRLKAELGPLVLLPLIDTFYGHWPMDLQEKLVAQFYQKMNDAELEYSTYTELFASGDPITGNALFSRLARNVLELSGHSPTNPAEHLVAYGIAIKTWKDMRLDKHIEAVERVL